MGAEEWMGLEHGLPDLRPAFIQPNQANQSHVLAKDQGEAEPNAEGV